MYVPDLRVDFKVLACSGFRPAQGLGLSSAVHSCEVMGTSFGLSQPQFSCL